jgi:hypothetical protein
MIGLLCCGVTVLLGRWRLHPECVTRRDPQLIHILTSGRDLNFHYLLAIFTFDFLRTTEILAGSVVTLSPPYKERSVKSTGKEHATDMLRPTSEASVRLSIKRDT